jgi:foldase protein PrsA
MLRFIRKTLGTGLLLLFFVCLSGCGGDSSAAKVVFTTGFGKDEVFRIEKETCMRAELMVYLTTTQNQYENVYGPEIWNTSLDGVSLEESIKENVLAKIAQIKTMYLLAKEKEIMLTDGELALTEQAAADYFSSLKDVEIREMGVTLETIRQLYREYAMADKVYREIIREINPEISDDEARIITVQDIIIRTCTIGGDGRIVEYSQNSKEQAYLRALEIHGLATDGQHDFAELAAEYSEEETVTYSFGKGEMETVVETEAFQLETGEISPVVEAKSGYHIMKCVSTFNREETDANKLKIVEQRKKEVFGQEYDEFVSRIARKLNEPLWEEITFLRDSQVTTSSFFDVYGRYF